MAKNKKLVVWDIDGTLLDTTQGVVNAVRYVLSELNLPKLSDETIKLFVGPPMHQSMSKYCGLEGDDLQKAVNMFRLRYKDYELFKACLYPGVEEVMSTIQESGLKQAIATFKREDYALNICRYFQFDRYCKPIFGADNENKLTKADIIAKCLTAHTVNDVADAVMIGDMDSDKNAAEQLGIDFIGVNYGFGFRDNENYAYNPTEILKKLNIGKK